MQKKSFGEAILEASGVGLLSAFVILLNFPEYVHYAQFFLGVSLSGMAYYASTWNRFNRIFKNLKLERGEAYPILKRKTPKEGYTLYEFTLPAGLTVDDFVKHQDAFSQYAGAEVSFDYGFKNLLMRVYQDKRKRICEYETVKTDGRLSIPIGYDRTGKLVFVDMSSGEPHLLIAGESGSGKSTALRSIITDLILTKDIDMFLVDLKMGAEFAMFRKVDKVKSFARTRVEAESLLRALVSEVERRYDMFYKNNSVDIKQYNRQHAPLRYQVLIIDEFADLMSEKTSIKLMEELSAKARACGVHLIISTQRPDMKVLNGRIKANVTNVLGLKTMNDVNSRIIIGRDGLEKLRGAGHGIFRRGCEETDVQCPFLSADRAQGLIRPYEKNKTKVPDTTIRRDYDGYAPRRRSD